MTDEADSNVNGSTVVRYTVKELLQEIRDDVKSMSAKLDTKADRSELITLTERTDQQDRRLDQQERRLDALDEKERQDAKAIKDQTDMRRWRVPLVLGAVYTIASPFLWNFVSHTVH